MATLAEQASKLLDFNQKLDITLLDNIVGCMYTGIGEQQRVAQEVLTTLKEHPNAWTRVDTILEYSQVKIYIATKQFCFFISVPTCLCK